MTSLTRVLFLDVFGKMQGWNSTGTWLAHKHLILWIKDENIHCRYQLIVSEDVWDNSIRLLANNLQRSEEAGVLSEKTRLRRGGPTCFRVYYASYLCVFAFLKFGT